MDGYESQRIPQKVVREELTWLDGWRRKSDEENATFLIIAEYNERDDLVRETFVELEPLERKR